ncbi:MAG: FkbM family methyltransferase [Pseudomonadota bacterium]
MLADLRRSLRSEGLTVQPIKTRAIYLKRYDFSPDVVFDIGVHAGTPWLYKTFPNAAWVLVDPQPEYEAAVRGAGLLDDFDYHAVALGAAAGQATLNVPETAPGKGGAMASLLERTDNLAKTFTASEARSVPVRTLDDIASDYDGRLGLKIDTEGYETEILRGAAETLQRADFVILELSLDPARFAATPTPSSAMSLLAAAGLELRDILAVSDGPGKRSRPRHMDALFTRWAA